MEKPVGILQAASPRIQILVNQLERWLIPMNGEIEQPLHLLLRSQMADPFNFFVCCARQGIGDKRGRRL